MKNNIFIAFFSISFFVADAQSIYFPDTAWQVKTATEMKMNKVLLDSAVKFAQANENKFDKDLRVATLKAYANEPDFKILGPTKERGGPAGLILKNGYIVAQWGDISRVDMTNSVTKTFLSTAAGDTPPIRARSVSYKHQSLKAHAANSSGETVPEARRRACSFCRVNPSGVGESPRVVSMINTSTGSSGKEAPRAMVWSSKLTSPV